MGLDVALAGLAAFSAGRHSSDLSAPFGHVLTTRPLHGTGLARLGRVLPLGIAPMQAGPICLVVDVSPDQRPEADIPAGLGLPVFIFSLGNDGLEMVFVSIHLYRSAEERLAQAQEPS